MRQLLKSCFRLFVKDWSEAALMKIPPEKHLRGSLHGKDVRTIDDDVYDENAGVLMILCRKKRGRHRIEDNCTERRRTRW